MESKEAIDDLMTRADSAVRANAMKVAGLRERRPGARAVEVGDVSVLEGVNQPTDLASVQFGKGLFDNHHTLLE